MSVFGCYAMSVSPHTFGHCKQQKIKHLMTWAHCSIAKWYRFCFIRSNIASVWNESNKKNRRKQNDKESAREEDEEKKTKQLQVQLILSAEQSIKIFHANAVIDTHTHSHRKAADLTTCKPNFQTKGTELYTALRMHANVTWAYMCLCCTCRVHRGKRQTYFKWKRFT